MSADALRPLSASRVGVRPGLALAFLCFAYVLVRPVSANQILLPVLATIGLLAACSLLFNSLRPPRGMVAIVWVQMLAGFTAIVHASLNANPGLWNESVVLIGGPLLFWTCVFAIRPHMIRPLLTTAAVATALLSTSLLLFVLGERGFVPQVLPQSIVLASGGGVGTIGDSVQLRFYGLSTLVGAAPLWITSLFLPSNPFFPWLWLRAYAASTAVLAAMLTGRRALVLLLVLTPALLLVVRIVLKARSGGGATRGRTPARAVIGSIVVGVGIMAVAPGLFTLDIVRQSAGAVVDTVTGAGTNQDVIRAYQSGQLLGAWADRPLAGHGAGAIIPGYFRDELRPWNFELQYHRLLFTQGLLGMILFVAVLLMAITVLRRAVRDAPEFQPVIAASTTCAAAMLLANGSNPYLQAVGHMWAIYLPLGVAAAALTGATGASVRTGSRSTELASTGSPRRTPESTGAR